MNAFSNFGKLDNFAKFAWFVVAYNVLVIVWGAFVRASKSGDGCGSHYPLCNGEIVPLSPTISTIIEFSHRISSGLDGILVLMLVVWAFLAFGKKHQIRRTAALSLFFVLTEAVIGAFLVKLELVANNVSMNRAIFMSVHLVNTLILLFFLTLTAWFASTNGKISWRSNTQRATAFGFGLFLMALVGMSGAVAALGNTLFPGHELVRGLQTENSSLLQFFLWLQLWHPFLSIISSLYLIALAQPFRTVKNDTWTRNSAFYTLVLVGVQIIFGMANMIFLAPIWMQLIHLVLADLLWIVFVVVSASALAEPEYA